MTHEIDDMLTTRLKAAAVHEARESRQPDPAAKVRMRAEHARARRRTLAVSLGVAAAIAGAVVYQQASTTDGLFTLKIDQAADGTRTPEPTRSSSAPVVPPPPVTPTGTPSPGNTPDPNTTDGGSDDAPTSSATASYPVPPTAHVERPWTHPGADYGNVVAARMEDGHAVITVDRVQIFTAEQWKAKTGQDEPMGFHTVNESTRTRQFIVEDDALLYGNWLLNAPLNDTRKFTPEQLVQRINQALVTQANNAVAGSSPPSVGVFLFHNDRVDGTVGYLEEASQYTG